MKKLLRITSLVLLTFVAVLTTQAQSTNKTIPPTRNAKDTSAKVRMTKTEKTQADADNYVRMAESAKSKLKVLFPSKPGDTVYAVIAGITYTDPYLKLLKQKLDDIKSTKGLTSSYHNNTAIIKIVYKGGDASKLYDNLSDEIKELFLPEDIEGSRIILTYKLAKSIESPGEKKLLTENTNQ